MSRVSEGVKAYLRVPFTIIVWFMETYGKNRDRLRALMAQKRVADTFKVLLALTAAVWIAVALMASDEQGQRLTDALQNFWSEAQDLNEQKKQLNQQQQDQQLQNGEGAQ